MSLPDQLLLSDLLNHTVRCDLGIDHGPGVMAWMHPPVHRLLGWISRPSALRMTREVWRLDQCCGLTEQQIFVRGEPASTDPVILEQLPTLIGADLVDRTGERMGAVVDLVFEPSTGVIRHYLISRSDPRLPGSSRWRLTPERIIDQQKGLVRTALQGLDDLPLDRSSVRHDLLKRTQRWREQLREMGDRAGGRLEGWLEDEPWDPEPESNRDRSVRTPTTREVWDEEDWRDQHRQRDEDPWV